MIKPKKYYGQHFLTDRRLAKKITDSLTLHHQYRNILEIGPGKGILSEFLFLRKELDCWILDIDPEAVTFLYSRFPEFRSKILLGDFLEYDLDFLGNSFGIIGNFPYNISSQILFRVLRYHNRIQEVIGMFQKEVADRLTAGEGNKTYGKLTVLMKAYYDAEYLFTVKPGAFFPVPKVRSAVLRFRRKATDRLRCNEELFFKVVLQGFQNRRKTLRNALKSLNLPSSIVAENLYFQKRAEQLSVDDFVELCLRIEQDPGYKLSAG